MDRDGQMRAHKHAHIHTRTRTQIHTCMHTYTTTHIHTCIIPLAFWHKPALRPIDLSERRLSSQLFHRFRICGVDIVAQTVELYFMDLFPDIGAA